MKKVFALLVCALMLLSGTGLAEEASQAVLAQAFMNRLQNAFQQFDFASTALRVSAGAQGQEAGSVTVQQDEGLVDVLVQAVSLGAPVEVQVTPESVYVSVNGTVYSLSNADLQEIVSWLVSQYGSVSQIDTAAYTEMAQLLLMYTLLPAVSSSKSDENTTVITVNLTAKQVLSGLSMFGDQVVSNSRYLDAVIPLLNMVFSNPITSEEFAAQWPAVKSQLAGVETDLALQGTVEITSLESSTLIGCDLTLTYQGANVNLIAKADADASVLSLTASLTRTYEEETVELISLAAEIDKAAGTLNARIESPQTGVGYALTAKAASESRAFSLDASLSMSAYGQTREILSLDVDADIYTGNIRAFLDLPAANSNILLTASFADTGFGGRTLQAMLTASSNNSPVLTFNMNAVYTGNVFTLNAGAVYNEKNVTLNIYKDRTSLNASLQTGEAGFVLQVFTNMRGTPVSFRFALNNESYNTFSMEWDGEKIVLSDGSSRYTVTYGFESESMFVINVEAERLYRYYTASEPETYNARIICELPDDGRLIEIRAIDVNGGEALKLLVEAVEKNPVIPLIGQETVTINKEFVETILLNFASQYLN